VLLASSTTREPRLTGSEEAPVERTEQDVVVDGRVLHVGRLGAGPPVVCLHGIADDGTCFEVVARDLARDHEVVLPDARGHGRSAAGPTADHGWSALAADTAGLVTALALTAPVLLGHSMGALTALLVASRNPDLPRALVLEDPPPRWLGPPDADDARSAARSRAELSELKRRTFEELVARQREVAPTWQPDEIERWARAKQRFHPDIVELFDTAGDDVGDLAAELSAVRCPTLLVTGDPDRGALVTPRAADALAGLVRDLEVVHLPGTGHSIRHDDPAGYGAAVRRFLDRIG
jgi:N-formylmaleamate deformylase